MEEDKSTSKVENKRPFEEDGETNAGSLFKHPKNESEELSNEDDDGYGGRLRPLNLKFEHAIQDYRAKQKKYAESRKVYMEAIKKPITKRRFSDLYAKQKICKEAFEERNDARFKSVEAHKELMWVEQLMDLSDDPDHDEIIVLIPELAEYTERKRERARAGLLGMIGEWETELELLRVEVKEHQANQQRLVVGIAFAVLNANLTNGDIAEIASATSKVNLTNDTIAAKEKLLRERRVEFESST